MDRVREIKRYITTKESSWERAEGINVIWNGATEEDHKNAGANGLGQPPQKTKALSIIFQKTRTFSNGGLYNSYDWLFFATDRGVSKLCEKLENAQHKVQDTKDQPARDGTPPWPHGTFEIKNLHGIKCDYKNDGKNNAGALWCEGRDGPIICQADPMREREKEMKVCKSGNPQTSQHAVVFCEW